MSLLPGTTQRKINEPHDHRWISKHLQRTIPLQGDVVTQLTGLSLDLDSVVEVLLVTGSVKDLVGGGDREVDNELVGSGGSSFRLFTPKGTSTSKNKIRKVTITMSDNRVKTYAKESTMN